MKTPYRDGTTHVLFEPLDFLARLAALASRLRPRINLTRFHGVFAPNSRHRALVTKAARGRGSKANASGQSPLDWQEIWALFFLYTPLKATERSNPSFVVPPDRYVL